MWTFIGRRLLVSLPLLLAVLMAAFFMLWALPGEPEDALLGRHHTPERAAEIRARLGLDDSLPVQFGRYLGDLAHGELGTSNATSRPVAEEVSRRIPATVELALAAMLTATIVGVSIGVLTALKPRSWFDMLGLTGALAGVSVPIFWLGVMVQRMVREGGWLSQAIPWFGGIDIGGRCSPTLLLSQAVDTTPSATGFYLYDTLFVFGDFDAFLDVAGHLALPALVLATVPAAVITRITRAAVGEVMLEDYIRTARAKGLGPRVVVTRHALRNAMIPIDTTTGTQLGYLLGGAVLTETIFSWPGLGTYIIEAIDHLDVRPLQAGILFIAIAFIAVNLLVDVSYGFLDPRVRRS